MFNSIYKANVSQYHFNKHISQSQLLIIYQGITPLAPRKIYSNHYLFTIKISQIKIHSTSFQKHIIFVQKIVVNLGIFSMKMNASPIKYG